MAHEDKRPMWQNYAIVHPDDANGLERQAAIHEFHEGLPRAHAEAKAHEAYRKLQHSKAAAHHLAGIKAGNATGDIESAQKHHALYQNHMKKLGLDPNGVVPPEIKAHEKSPGHKVYDFKPHGADQFLVGDK